MRSRSERFAELAVTCSVLSGPEIEERIGLPGDIVESAGDEYEAGGRQRRRVRSAWIVRSVAPAGQEPRVDAGTPIEIHLDWLLETLTPVLDKLRAIHAAGAEVVLRIVQYMAPDEFQGHGIPLGADWVSLLADLGASVDIDQYVRSEPEV